VQSEKLAIRRIFGRRSVGPRVHVLLGGLKALGVQPVLVQVVQQTHDGPPHLLGVIESAEGTDQTPVDTSRLMVVPDVVLNDGVASLAAQRIEVTTSRIEQNAGIREGLEGKRRITLVEQRLGPELLTPRGTDQVVARAVRGHCQTRVLKRLVTVATTLEHLGEAKSSVRIVLL